MTALFDRVPPPMRSPWSFMGSICLHGWVLAWVALGTSLPLERRKSLYEREIQPNEKRIVWYKLSDRLPDVTPPAAKRDARPLRARKMFDQNLAAGARDDAGPPQLIGAPAPEITPAKPLPLPNIVAIAPPPRPPARLFIPPPVKELAPERAPTLPDAPALAAAVPDAKAPVLDLKAPHAIRRFTPPKQPKLPVPADPPPLPAAPELASTATNLAAEVSLPRQQHKFVPPAKHAVPPQDPGTIAPPPAITAAVAMPSDNSLVIAGLNPAKSIEVP